MEKGIQFLLGRKVLKEDLPGTLHANSVVCKKVTESFSDSITSIATEPSLAYFRIQEHVRKCTPEMLDAQVKVGKLQSEIIGCCFDMDCALSAVTNMSRATVHFSRINELLKSSLFAKLQLDYVRKQSRNFEVGIDATLLDIMEVNDEISSQSHSGTGRLQMLRSMDPILSKSNDTTSSETVVANTTVTSNNNDKFKQLSHTFSTTAVHVRDHALSLTRRALFTRSADISSIDFSSPQNKLSSSVSVVPSLTQDSRLTEEPVSTDERIVLGESN